MTSPKNESGAIEAPSPLAPGRYRSRYHTAACPDVVCFDLAIYHSNKQGSAIKKVEVIEAVVIDGHSLLRDAALHAARQWEFTPTEFSGKLVKVVGILTFNFSLK